MQFKFTKSVKMKPKKCFNYDCYKVTRHWYNKKLKYPMTVEKVFFSDKAENFDIMEIPKEIKK